MTALANLISLAIGCWLALMFGYSLTALLGWWNLIWLPEVEHNPKPVKRK